VIEPSPDKASEDSVRAVEDDPDTARRAALAGNHTVEPGSVNAVNAIPPAEPEPARPSLLRQALNVPNILSLLRLAGVPVFLWLLLGPEEDGWALALLVFSALTDWLDGKLARWLNQMSQLGQLLDPAADRLYIVATLAAFLVRGIVPWWVVAPLVLRELIVGICILVLRRDGFAPPEVTYIGKGATFVLMYAFPFLLLTQGGSTVAAVARPIAYAFMIWGCVLYLWSGALYVLQTIWAIRGAARARQM
jgi:cardiolipin synthase